MKRCSMIWRGREILAGGDEAKDRTASLDVRKTVYPLPLAMYLTSGSTCPTFSSNAKGNAANFACRPSRFPLLAIFAAREWRDVPNWEGVVSRVGNEIAATATATTMKAMPPAAIQGLETDDFDTNSSSIATSKPGIRQRHSQGRRFLTGLFWFGRRSPPYWCECGLQNLKPWAS